MQDVKKKILKNTAVVGSLTACSRVLGLVREMMQARAIGAGVEQSAFAIAFAVPNMARKLFGEGALTAAFVPVFKGEVDGGALKSAERLARAVMTMSLLMLAAAVLLAAGGIECVSAFFRAHLSDRATITLRLVRTMLPYMVFICGAAFGTAVLNSLGRFKASAFMPCLLNIFWIAALAWMMFGPGVPPGSRVNCLAWAILAAGAAQMAFLLWRMRRAGISPRPSFSGWSDEKVRLVWRNTAVAALGAGAVQLNCLADQVLAYFAAPWAAGVIGYAERLMDLPLGIVGVAFGTVLLPAFAGRFAAGDEEGARDAFVSSARSMLFVMVPAAVGLGIVAPQVVDVVYLGREFDSVAAVRVSRAVSCYSAGIVFFGLQKALVPWFQGQNDMKTPLAVSLRTVLLNFALNLAAVFLLPQEWRHVGLAGSTVVCSAAGCLMLSVHGIRRNGSMGFERLAVPVAKICAASAIMAGALVLVRGRCAAFAASRGLGGPGWALALLSILVASGVAAYFLASAALRARRQR